MMTSRRLTTKAPGKNREAYLWGLAANGQAGVENVLDILRSGIDSALLGLGHSSVHDLSPADLLIPPRVTHGLEPADASVTSPA